MHRSAHGDLRCTSVGQREAEGRLCGCASRTRSKGRLPVLAQQRRAGHPAAGGAVGCALSWKLFLCGEIPDIY